MTSTAPGGNHHVMDNLLNSDRDVGFRNGDHLYFEWIYSHPASARVSPDSCDRWASNRLRRCLQREKRSWVLT